jgi:hypothetical protein
MVSGQGNLQRLWLERFEGMQKAQNWFIYHVETFTVLDGRRDISRKLLLQLLRLSPLAPFPPHFSIFLQAIN